MSEPGIRILLVEDDEDDYVLTRDLLAEMGRDRFVLEWARTWDAGAAALSRQEHDVYLVDYHLGANSGLELLLQAMEATCPAPIILLTGQDNPELDASALKAGAADYLVKGRLDASSLERAIRYALERKRSEAELRALSSRQEAMLAALPDIVVEVDCRKVYTWMNTAGIEFFGADALGKEAATYFEGEQETYAAVQPLFDGDERTLFVESWQRNQEGKKRLLAWWCRVLKDDRGTVTGAISTARDITERLAQEQARIDRVVADQVSAANQRAAERLEKACNAGSVALYEWELTTHAVHWSENVDLLLGYATGEIPRSREGWMARLHPDDAPRILDALERHHATRLPFQEEYRVLTQDGSIRWWRDRADTVFDAEGKAQVMTGACLDITDRVAATDAVMAARTAAECANRAKSAFLASMSHEIRTPMNAILGFAQLLRRDGTLTEQQKQHVSTILRSGDYLLSLISNILEYSKIEAGRIELAEATFDLQRVLEEIEVMFRARAETKHLRLLTELSPPGPCFLVSDELRLRQVLVNLLANALRFTEHGHVTLRATVRPGSPADGCAAKWLVVEVEDTGSGIAPAEMPRLFQVFEQTESGRRSRSGTGLGLAISRKFAQLLGGTLTARSQVDQGSVFRLEIPVRGGARVSSGTRSALRQVASLEPGQPGLRVLVADDKEDNRAFLAALLGAVGFEVRVVEDGQQAVRSFASWKPALILMDLSMPVMTGPEAIRLIRQRVGGAEVKIIAVTASAFQEDRRGSLEAGADDFLSKPFREEVLFEKIQSLLGVRYRFAEESTPTRPAAPRPSATALRSAAATLPADHVEALRQATLSADVERILELASQAEAHSPEVASEVRRLAAEFAYPELLDLLEIPEPQPVDRSPESLPTGLRPTRVG